MKQWTIWDLIRSREPKLERTVRARNGLAKTTKHKPRSPEMQAKYDAMVRELLAEHGVRVRRWRSSMTGCAWEVLYHDGSISRLIEAPKPKGPMSAAVFLHEIGHHAIGFNRYKPRCLEEHMAWAWAVHEMHRRGLNVTESVERRVHMSMRYAIAKAERRGIKALPEELHQYLRNPAA